MCVFPQTCLNIKNRPSVCPADPLGRSHRVWVWIRAWDDRHQSFSPITSSSTALPGKFQITRTRLFEAFLLFHLTIAVSFSANMRMNRVRTECVTCWLPGQQYIRISWTKKLMKTTLLLSSDPKASSWNVKKEFFFFSKIVRSTFFFFFIVRCFVCDMLDWRRPYKNQVADRFEKSETTHGRSWLLAKKLIK